MTAFSRGIRWTSPIGVGLLVGFGGFVMAGVAGGFIGFIAGVASARRPETVLLAAAVSLFVAAVFTVLEAPLTEARVPTFPHDHPVAEFAAKTAAVLLLAGLVGILARRGRAAASRTVRREWPAPRDGAPVSTIMALLAAVLLAALVLWQLGDQRWQWEGLALAIVVIGLGSLVVFARWRPSRPGR